MASTPGGAVRAAQQAHERAGAGIDEQRLSVHRHPVGGRHALRGRHGAARSEQKTRQHEAGVTLSDGNVKFPPNTHLHMECKRITKIKEQKMLVY